ncbi:myosin light chain 3, related protein [Toxoplasma gondii GAB2-2007-GAL-DOM2]|uniref:Myosin light chain 3, related protein n=7 Tax=Toxoplasma gondii TaxID=5811 RepID=S7WG53_TOXGG|nr:hypothetical protein TGGT1_250840 [Toxoplasma gondii GT1]KAF4638802.1 hypothetical protein TGRH88_064110 [Toxoplasma gondii]KFG33676.1 myosin light chain 3, related protein [Toxoplasma gondii FOU]KFG40739.1 myosin light chain 3, related protein [Toxoplasma gondii GAB2-2007-GAL-DOM2]RQX70505.1 myosin light chain 3, related protein [Toxoplasma gondii CAST]
MDRARTAQRGATGSAHPQKAVASRKYHFAKKAVPTAKGATERENAAPAASYTPPAAQTHIPFNPLIGGGEAEHNFVIFQRLQLDSSEDRERTLTRRDSRAALATQELVQRISLRKEIDLSYLPEGHVRRDEETEKPFAWFFGGRGRLMRQREREPFPDEHNATLGRLKAQLEYIRRWGVALHENDFVPAARGQPALCPKRPAGPVPPVCYSDVPRSSPLAGTHAGDCDNFAELAGLTPREARKRENARRRLREAGEDHWSAAQGAWSCPAGAASRPESASAGPRRLRRPLFVDPATQPGFTLYRPEALDVDEALREAEEAGRKKVGGDSFELDLTEEEQRELNEMLAEHEGFATDVCHVDVKAMAQFFDMQRIPPSQRVKMLELDLRSFLVTMKKLQSAKTIAEEQLQKVRKEKEAMAKDIAAREERLKQTEAAVRLALKDHLRIQRTLQATVKAGSEIIEKEQNKVATIKRSETRLQVQMEEASLVNENQAEEIEALKAELAEMKQRYDEYENKMFIDNKAYHEEQIKLEKFYYRCLSLGEDRLRLLEALRREKANLDVRSAELVLYKQQLEDVTEDRQQIKAMAGKTQQKMMQDRNALLKKWKQETTQKNSIIAAKTRELEEMKEQKAEEAKQAARYRAVSTLRLHEMKKMRNIIDLQQTHIKKQSSNYEDFLKSILAFQGKLTVLSKLAKNIRTFYEEHGDEFRGRAEPGSDRQSNGGRRSSTSSRAEEKAMELSRRRSLPQSTHEAVKSQFQSAAKGGDTIAVDQAVRAARTMGLAPSLADIESLRSKAANARVDSAAFSAFCESAFHADEASKLASFFRTWDPKEKGTLQREVVKNLLQTFGEPLTAEEAEFAIHVLAEDAETINYRDFCEKLVALVPQK